MKTDELIVELARSARPMRPLSPPPVRAGSWFAAAALVMSLAVVMIGPRADLIEALGQPIFFGSLAALLLTLVCGAFAAFALAVPGAERSPVQRALPLLTAATWSAVWLVALATAGSPSGRVTAPIHLMCAIEIAVSALVTGALLFVMLARAAPLRPLWTAAVASLASMATGAVVAQVLCPLDDPTHQLIGHVGIAFAVAGLGVVIGGRTLDTWRRK